MIKKTLAFTFSCAFLTVVTYSQDKKTTTNEIASPTKTVEATKNSKVMKNTTDVSENTSHTNDLLLKEAGILKTIFNNPTLKVEQSKELKALLQERNIIIKELNQADKTMSLLISKSLTWDKERNTEKKGHLDTILDKADRLAFSNELRMSMSSQAKAISSLIHKLNVVEVNISTQKVNDEGKRQTEALKLQVDFLEKQQKLLIEKIKNQESNTVTVNSTESVQKKREENVEYYTITDDTNLQTIALSYYQDHEKWTIIFDHPDNQNALKKKSPTDIIPIGTVLTIPKETEEQ